MRLKRLGVITVVMAMVLSLAGLASAADGDSTEASATTIEQGSEPDPFVLEDPTTDPLISLVSFVLYWGIEGFENPDTENPCYVAPTVAAAEAATSTTLPTVCLDVSGPNGQVNHGQFMKAFVHWLKSDDGMTLLGDYYEGGGKKGHLVRQAAHNAFGKGQWKKENGLAPTVDTTKALETADTDEDEPNHAYGHSNPKNPHSGS